MTNTEQEVKGKLDSVLNKQARALTKVELLESHLADMVIPTRCATLISEIKQLLAAH